MGVGKQEDEAKTQTTLVDLFPDIKVETWPQRRPQAIPKPDITIQTHTKKSKRASKPKPKRK